ncbi:MAG: hypothetical protein FJ126_06395 [Deltaproteobacteria bacterium]|nr:hypothetical protein [Deltaproteobacteria bacterium]
MGSLSGFDRSVFRGTLRRLSYPQGMDYCLAFLGGLLKGFVKYVLEVTARFKEASLTLAAPKRRQSSAVTRKLRLLRAHGLIKKVPITHRHLLTTKGSKTITSDVNFLLVREIDEHFRIIYFRQDCLEDLSSPTQ